MSTSFHTRIRCYQGIYEVNASRWFLDAIGALDCIWGRRVIEQKQGIFLSVTIVSCYLL